MMRTFEMDHFFPIHIQDYLPWLFGKLYVYPFPKLCPNKNNKVQPIATPHSQVIDLCKNTLVLMTGI